MTIEIKKLPDQSSQQMVGMSAPNKKGQYALRAIYELAKRKEEAPVKISTIARAQAIPLRFLEVILNQLKGSGLVVSKRGFYGGYTLTKPPREITVGEILEFIQQDIGNAKCIVCVSQKTCPFFNKCVFSELWQKARNATFTIYNATTIQDLLDAGEAIDARESGETSVQASLESLNQKRSKRIGKEN